MKTKLNDFDEYMNKYFNEYIIFLSCDQKWDQ